MTEEATAVATPAKHRVARSIGNAIILVALPPAGATVLGFLATLNWGLDLFAHFRVQYFVSLMLAGVALLALKRWRWAAGFGVLAAVNFAVIVPLYAGRDPAAPGPAVRAMLMNVNTRYGDPARVAQAIAQVDPDVVVLEEVSKEWLEDLESTIARYPYTEVSPRDDNFGIALLSRFPLDGKRTELIGSAGVPTIVAEVQTPQGLCTIIATHPLPPRSAEYTAYRNEQFAGLAQAARNATLPVLLIGDLNCTPWSPYFARLVEDSKLQDSMKGWGVQASWPADSWMLRIPIDHCLHSPTVQITRREIGPNVASDHLPLILEFRLR